MKIASLFILFIYCAFPGFCNTIDSLKTDADVIEFFTHLTGKKTLSFTEYSKDEEQYHTYCDSLKRVNGIPNWAKADFNNDGITDISANFFYETFYESYVAIDNGNNTFKIHHIRKNTNNFCLLIKPINIDKNIFLNVVETAHIPKNKVGVFNHLLQHSYGGFIEANSNPQKIQDVRLIRWEQDNHKYTVTGGGVYELIKKKDRVLFRMIAQRRKHRKSEKTFVIPASAEKFDSIVKLINYINFSSLQPYYMLMSSMARIKTLNVTFSNGRRKKIIDIGHVGTFGLQRLYKLLDEAALDALFKNKRATEMRYTYFLNSRVGID